MSRLVDATPLVTLLESITSVAIEHEARLTLTAFVNLVDLYAHHIALGERETGETCLPFDTFVHDGPSLAEAARAAELAGGVSTAVPEPLPGEGSGMPPLKDR